MGFSGEHDMSDAITSIAFIGFGEAAQAIAAGLRETHRGLSLSTTDPRFSGPDGRDLRERADAIGVTVAGDIPAAVRGCDLVLSMVVAKVAVEVARAARDAAAAGARYLDLNSASPATKQAVAAALAGSGFEVVDGAMMAAVPPKRHRVPTLLSGPAAATLAARLGALGFHVEVVGDAVGTASAIKMFRSIMIKGLEALMLECVEAARHYGAAERVLESVATSFPGVDWKERATYFAGRTALHGKRRAAEMHQVAETLRALGVDPAMVEAAARRLAWGAGIGLESPCETGGFTSLAELCQALEAAERKSS